MNNEKEYTEATIATILGGAIGGLVSGSIGNAGLAFAGTAIALGPLEIVLIGAAIGFAGYCVYDALRNNEVEVVQVKTRILHLVPKQGEVEAEVAG